MLIKEGSTLDYLYKYRDGTIQQGLGINLPLDDFLKFKRSQMVMILGHDNVGKTYWLIWYMLALSSHHNLKWCIWSGENNSGQLMRDLIQMYSGMQFKSLTHTQIQIFAHKIEGWFKFVDNGKLYKPHELLKLFGDTECDAALIDPYTGLDRDMNYEGNYKFLNETRQFCNETGKTMYINTHPNTESGRNSMLYTSKDGDWEGHLKPPLKDHIEGGKAFLNRCDDMIVIHRMVKHQIMRYTTMVNVEKIKDSDTGGKHTLLGDPLMFDFNYGLGFKMGGLEGIKRGSGVRTELRQPVQQEITDFFDSVDKQNKDWDTIDSAPF